MPKRTLLFLGGSFSFTAQLLLFAPWPDGSIPHPVQEIGVPLLFTAAGALYVLFIRTYTAGQSIEWFLPVIQACTITGIFFILQTSGPGNRGTGVLVTGLITLLTTAPLFVMTRTAGASMTHPLEFSPPGEEDNSPAGDLVLHEQVHSLKEQLQAEKHRASQLTLLHEFSQQLEAELDPPVSAQLAVNTLERAMDCSVVTLFLHEPDRHEFVVLASAGAMTSLIPPGYRQPSSLGILGRTVRTKKTSMVNNTRLDPDFLQLENDNTLSLISVPVFQHGHVKGVLEICSEKAYAFTSADASLSESVASELMRAWERASYHQRLAELIQAGVSLTTLMDPQAAVEEIAAIARKTLEAQFVFVTLLDQQGNFSRTASSGEGKKLNASLNSDPADEPLMQAALNATKPFRVRDLRKYANTGKIEIDHSGLRSTLAIPIRLHRLSIGAIMAFGKQEGIFFSENDESLGDLLSSQAAASIESAWLYQELRNNLNITSMLYQLSVDVIQTEELSRAAELIAQAAHKVTNSRETGIVLVTHDGKIQTDVQIDAKGMHRRREHPVETIDQAIMTGQSIIVSVENGSLVCYPLLTRGRTYGALWMNIPESRGQNFANLQTLANQAAIALERSILLSESRQQASQIETAYTELEITYDRTLTALMSALDARDRDTEGHSTRVSQLACMLGEALGLNGQQLKALERGALLHDIGKIGISDTILHKPGRLTDEERGLMRLHTEIGARIVEGIPFLQETLPVIRYHHERWNGSGYPSGLKGNEIPIQARIFAVADVFDALTSSRSYRTKSTPAEAIQYLIKQSGSLFDPSIVQALMQLPYADFVQREKTSV